MALSTPAIFGRGDFSSGRYGASATFLTVANAFTGQLMTPVVSVNLARPRIANVRFGTLPFVFAGSAGDIYGRFIGYYFLNILAWGVALAIVFIAIGGTVSAGPAPDGGFVLAVRLPWPAGEGESRG